ncbi:MAG: DUF5702 domain-containing protein [Roseburia sp.]|nr:DUF5702 domain-containing protein [Roseburia sp.]
MTKKNNQPAGITVFLSLTLLIIMALLGTMVEVTRGKVCRVYGRHTLRAATDSLLTEYSRPLYEEYHLFFIEDAGKSFEKSIAEYAADALETEGIAGRGTDLYDGALTNVVAEQKKYMGDDGGEELKRQIADYMKRSIASDAFDKFRGSTEPAEQIGESASELDQKVKEEKEAAAQDGKMLQLMKWIDGVKYSGGEISASTYFVKMFYFGECRAEDFGITEASVWRVVKKRLVNAEEMIEQAAQNPAQKNKFLTQVKQAVNKAEQALQAVKDCGENLSKQNLGGDAAAFLASNLRIFRETEKILGESLTKEHVSELKQLWKGYDTSGVRFSYSGIGEEGGAPNPMDSFKDAISGGLSRLVVEDTEKISKKKTKHADNYKKLYGSKEEDNDYAKDVQDFAENEELDLQGAVKDFATASMTDYLLFEYLKKFFSSVSHPTGKMEKRLDYEWEYIVCGGESDRENLEQVINRLVLMRTVVNTALIFSSSSKRETAHAAALAVVGFTGMEPLIRFTQTLFIVLWGMTESLVDVAALLQNKKVPILKTEKDMVVEFPELYRISHQFVMEKAKKLSDSVGGGLDYEQYLMLFMLGNQSQTVCCRMMDLMEWNIKDNYFKGFNLGVCVSSFCVRGEFFFPTKFFQLPFIQNVLKREKEWFGQEVILQAGYVSE